MNVLVIPSWYPTDEFPITGIFFKEQTLAMAKIYPKVNLGISLWGSHDKRLWLDAKSWRQMPSRLYQKMQRKASANHLLPNCIEYFDPAFTWTRKIWSGNINGIIEANMRNAMRFQAAVGKIDVIHAHVGYPAGYIASALSQRLGCPYIITEHMGPFPFASLKTKVGRLIPKLRQAYQNASLVTAVSNYLKDEMGKCGIEVSVIHNYLDPTIFSTAKSSKNDRVLFIGNISQEKGINDLYLAWQKVVIAYPHFSLDVVGESNGDDDFLPLNYDHFKNVLFHGQLEREKVEEAIQKCDFLVLPSRLETFGVVLIEAMACGKPVVATLCGGPEDIVNERTGLLAKAKDPDDLAMKMIEMIENLHRFDPNVIRAEFMRKFSSQVICTKWLSVYEETILKFKSNHQK